MNAGEEWVGGRPGAEQHGGKSSECVGTTMAEENAVEYRGRLGGGRRWRRRRRS
jgi:hypothetical protein